MSDFETKTLLRQILYELRELRRGVADLEDEVKRLRADADLALDRL